MIYKKGAVWKVSGNPTRFDTKEEAEASLVKETPSVSFSPLEKTAWSPLEKLRGKASCEECECEPCECEKEWKSADET